MTTCAARTDELGRSSVLTRDAKTAIKAAIKDLEPARLMRDSVAHPEDRGVGRDRKGKPIEWTNPEEMGMRVGRVTKSTGVAYGPNFVKMTAGDGTHPIIPVAVEYVAQVRDYVQAVIDALEWDPEGWAARWVP